MESPLRDLERARRPVATTRVAACGLFALLFLGSVGVSHAQGDVEGAEEAPTYSRDGFYMGVRAIYGVPYFAVDEPPRNFEVENGRGFGINIGYRTHRFLAAEFDIELMDPGYKIQAENIRNFGMTLYGKAYPLSAMGIGGKWLDRFQPYVKVGAGFQYFYQKEGDAELGFVGRFGVGSEFYLTRRLALTFDANYVLTSGPIGGLNAWSLGVIGLQWRFN